MSRTKTTHALLVVAALAFALTGCNRASKQLAWLALQQSCAEQRIALAVAVGLPISDSSPSTP